MENNLKDVDKINLVRKVLVTKRQGTLDNHMERMTYYFFLCQSFYMLMYDEPAFQEEFIIDNGKLQFPYLISGEYLKIYDVNDYEIEDYEIDDKRRKVARAIYFKFWNREISSLKWDIYRLSPPIYRIICDKDSYKNKIVEIDNFFIRHDLMNRFPIWGEFFTIPDEVLERWQMTPYKSLKKLKIKIKTQ